jgi:flagella basal body P-ring formation protein FlgA
MSNQTNDQRRPHRAWMTAAAATAALRLAAPAHGQTTVPATAPAALATAPERFVADASVAAGGTLSVRSQATVAGADVRLRDVCRWTDADAPTFSPLADLVVTRLGDGGSSVRLGVDSLRATLGDAGVNLGTVRLSGSATCAVTRDLAAAVAASAEPPAVPAPAVAVPAASGAARPTAAEVECNPFHTLRDRLAADAAQRLNVPAADLQLTFAAADANLLNLTEPTFSFQVEAKHVRDLGRVSWDVTVTNGGATQHAVVTADARAWQDQLVLASPAAYHEVLRPDDVTERRVLVTQMGDDPPLTRKQAVGQQAARDLKPGTVLTGKLIDPVPLAKVGQYVTVTLTSGGVQVRTVAKAMEAGTYGQTIKVRNEATRDEYQVTLSGPQVATMGPGPDANVATIHD